MNIALIPARAGSKRLPGKNIRMLAGKPLIYYSIKAAIDSKQFSSVIVSTDSPQIAEIAKDNGAVVPSLRPAEYATDVSCDIDWVTHAINFLVQDPLELDDIVAILRPTNPLRSSTSIIQAVNVFKLNTWADSLRAMQVTNKHPGKMWLIGENNLAKPYLNQEIESIPTHDRPTQSLQKVWVQNASLEIMRVRTIMEMKSISGNSVYGFEMPGQEGYDINDTYDFEFLQWLVLENPKLLG
jgi:CMP-N-acetylneuraminic acid synthetase